MNDNRNIIFAVREAAAKNADRPALISKSGGRTNTVSFGELWEQIDAFSVGLRKLGFGPGDRAIIMLPMSVELYVMLLGAIKVGGTVIFVDPWINLRQIGEFCAFAEPKAFLGTSKSHLLRAISSDLRRIPISISTGTNVFGMPARHSLSSLLAGNRGDDEIFEVDDSDTALITFTSGAAGKPKGAKRTHGYLRAQYRAAVHEFPGEDDDINMAMFPGFALSNLAGGITTVIPYMDFRRVDQINPEAICKQIREHGVTTCIASPPFYDRLAKYVREHEDFELTLRRAVTGGAPVSTEQLQRWHYAFEGTTFQIVYGCTEVDPVARIDLETRMELNRTTATKNKGFCTGKPSKLLRAKIIRIHKGPIETVSDWTEMELAEGEVGELIVAGAHVCQDYYNNLEAMLANKVVDADGTVWHRMGDTGYFDEEGRFWLVGRLHSTIVRNGENFHAQVVEQTVYWQIKEATQVAAVGMPDDILGEKTVLVIRTNSSSFTTAEIQEIMMKRHIPVDEIVVTQEKLPLDPRHNSKIDYPALKVMLLKKQL